MSTQRLGLTVIPGAGWRASDVRNVAREAEARGLRITDSEIVGLVPEAALGEGDTAHVRLRGFDAGRQVLERQIEGAG